MTDIQGAPPFSILIVDDDPDLCTLIRKNLRRLGYATEQCLSGYEALSKLMDTNSMDLIILDYKLSDMTAASFVSTLKDQDYTLPFIVMTGYGDERVAVEMMKLGARDYIIKDAGLLELLPSVVHRIVNELDNEYRLTRIEKEKDRLFKAIETTKEAVTITTKDGYITYANTAMANLHGYDKQDLLGKSPELLLSQNSQYAIGQIIDYVDRFGLWEGELINLKKDGTEITTYTTVSAVKGKKGQALNYIVTKHDISESKKAKEEIKRLNQFQETIIDNANIWLNVLDKEHNVLIWNKAAREISGYDKAEVLGNGRIWQWLHPEESSRANVLHIFGCCVNGNNQYTENFESNIECKNGHNKVISWNIKPLHDENGTLIGSMLIGNEITAQRQAESMVHYLSHYDQLTGLANRELFQDRFQHALARIKRYKTKLALITVDIHKLKTLNETMGHTYGDMMIQKIAQRLEQLVREVDTVSRFGSDEFVILLEDINNQYEIKVFAERLIEELKRPCQLGDMDFFPNVAMGYSISPDDGMDQETLLQKADMAMHAAKKYIHNKLRRYSPEIGAQVSSQFHLEQRLWKALENEEFILHYQPQIDLKDNSFIAIEALIRWSHPQRGLLYPAAFLPVLEKSGLIKAVGNWVVQAAGCSCRNFFLNGFSSLRVAVNISANQLRDVKFLDNIKAALDKTQFDPRSLAVEITESEAMQNINIAAHILKTLSDWGVLILLDDFGKEYSSLNTLKVLPVDIVKIDKSFLINIPHNQQNASLVSTMITMAHNLGKEILAEGVENMEQLSFLMNNNCNYAQGYYFAKPMPIEHLQDILVSSGGHIYK